MSAIGERQFGPYRLVQQIAVGGMAEIHLAKTHGIAGFEKYVALKMIHPNFSQDSHFIQMLIDEAKITVQLQHVNIAQTFDLGRVGDTFYITMEYVDGADLYRLLRRSSEQDRLFPIALGAFIGKEVASGLDYAHRKRDHNGQPLGIVHRDVSPQNVLISYAGEVKLVDFGIAKATMRARQTAAGVIKGKYYYMSPEQAWGEPLDHRTDIFSAGILLYETLTGQMLYLEEDLHKLLDRVRRAEIPPPSTLRADIPPQLDAIVMRALSKQPEGRYQSAAELAHELERFLHAYAPVFTANKVTAWMSDVLGHAGAPAPPVERKREPEPEPEPERDRGQTRRLTGDQLVRARSEFTDENSIIFGALDEEGSESRGTDGDRGGTDETSTFDVRVPGGVGDDEADVDSLPEAPRDHPSASVKPAAPASPERITANLPVFVEPPTRRRLPGLPGVSPQPRADAGEDDATAAVLRASPSSASRGMPAAAEPRARDQDTRLLRDASGLPAPPSAADDGAADDTDPADVRVASGDDDGGAASPDDATIISDGPGWWSGPGDLTEVAEAPFGEQSFVPPPGEVDHDAPTLLKIPPVVVPKPGAQSWERAPALAARVPQPAVSQLKPPRTSRRTPTGGVPVHGPGPELAASRGRERPLSSVLASLLATGERSAAEVALSPPTRLDARQGDAAPGGRSPHPSSGAVSSRHAPAAHEPPAARAAHPSPHPAGAVPSRHAPAAHEPPAARAAHPSPHPSSGAVPSRHSPAAHEPPAARAAHPSPHPSSGAVSSRHAPAAHEQPAARAPHPSPHPSSGAVPSRHAPAAHEPPPAHGSGAIESSPVHPSPPPQAHGQYGRAPEQMFPGGGMPDPQNSFSTRAMVAALERDEIPDHYKIRRRKQPTAWLIGLSALVLSTSVAGLLIAIYGTGDSEAGGDDAVLQLISVPSGATVTVDGQVLSAQTPTAIHGAPGKRFVIRFEKARYQREEQEFVVPDQGDVHRVVARLDPMVVRLSVESEPTGAEVFIGGNSVGRTPLELPGLDPQTTTSIELRLKGYRPVRQQLDWSQKTDAQLSIKLTE
jgi:serine/threonine protein kinase